MRIVFMLAETIFRLSRPTGRLPIPRHPAARSDKPELRQQLTDPKRVICLGSFFCWGLALVLGDLLLGRTARVYAWLPCLLTQAKTHPRAPAPSRPACLPQPSASTR